MFHSYEYKKCILMLNNEIESRSGIIFKSIHSPRQKSLPKPPFLIIVYESRSVTFVSLLQNYVPKNSDYEISRIPTYIGNRISDTFSNFSPLFSPIFCSFHVVFLTAIDLWWLQCNKNYGFCDKTKYTEIL